MQRIGIYLRISDDRDGNQTATERQRVDCERYAESHGFEVADVFEDVDLSAYKKGTKRPEFERMLTAVRDKQIDGVLSWKIDRITRRQRDLVRLDEACEDAKSFIATVVEGIDTRQPTGRFVAELLVAQARMESENSLIRVTRKHEERAVAGKTNVGGTRLFGYTRDRMHFVAEEAALIRELYQRVLSGESMRGVCFDWGRRNVKTATGRVWTQTSLLRFLTSAAPSGQRDYKGVLSKGEWPAIVSPEDHRRMRLLLHDNSMRKPGAGAKYLLSGILRCSHCGAGLIANPIKNQKRYGCKIRPGLSGCGKLTRVAAPIDEFVSEAVFLRLDGIDLTRFVTPLDQEPDTVLDDIRADEAQLTELSNLFADKLISSGEWITARNRIETRLKINRTKHNRQNGRSVLDRYLGHGSDLREVWCGLGLDQKRDIVAALIDRVTVHRGVSGSTRFNPELYQITWKV